MNRLFTAMSVLALAVLTTISCQKSETLMPDQATNRSAARLQDGTPERLDAVTSASVAFEAGALSLENREPGVAATTTVSWVPDFRANGDLYRFYLKRDDTGDVLAGVASNNNLSHANRIVTYNGPAGAPWQFTVPFVLARKYHGGNFQEAIATPSYKFGYPPQLTQTKFVEAVNGIATITVNGVEWKAAQGDLVGTNAARVVIQKDGVTYTRTNGNGENGTLVALAVLRVRTGATLASGKLVNVYEDVPFVLIQRTALNAGLSLQARRNNQLTYVLANNLKF